MKVVFVLFDSLVRNALGCYDGKWMETPNFDRFSEKAIVYDNHYVGSLPCMPARRDIHTGRLNFFHRSWSPLEPFDNSFVKILRDSGVYTHLISDHSHYFEAGGWNYHLQFNSWEYIRGQETDRWKAMVQPPLERFREKYNAHQYSFELDKNGVPKDWKSVVNAVNREFIKEEKDFPCVQCFDEAFQFLDGNHHTDNWFLQIECFDPHEPFHAPKRFRERYNVDEDCPILDWPRYGKLFESDFEKNQIKANYAALTAMCDEYFGKLLAYFDEHNLWEDTALMLTTDHGFMLAEHDWWGKNRMPFYNEIARIPLLVYHPDAKGHGGEHRQGLTQNMDLMPTILDMFHREIPSEVCAQSLLPTLTRELSLRDAAVYGIFGGSVNVTDGQYTYFLYPENMSTQELYEYTLMPTHIFESFDIKEFDGVTIAEPFDFTKNVKTMKIFARHDAARPPGVDNSNYADCNTVLYDLQKDPAQSNPITQPEVIKKLKKEIAHVMREHDAPPEAYRRINLSPG